MATAVAAAEIGGIDREYETIYVLRPDVEKARAEEIATRMNDVIVKAGGKLTRVENWGRRVLAYAVARHKRGVYVYLKYVGRGDIVTELERNLRMMDTVIKFQTVKTADAVSVAQYAVEEQDVKFEHVDPPTEEEEDESLARSLGLEGDFNPAEHGGRDDDGDGEGDMEGVGDDEEGS